MNQPKFGDEWYKSLRNYEEQAQNAARESHIAGDCGDIDAGCSYCRAELDQAKARACVDAFLPLVGAARANAAFAGLFELKAFDRALAEITKVKK